MNNKSDDNRVSNEDAGSIRTIEDFEDIIAWQKARELSKKVYNITKKKEFNEDRSLKDQMRRAATSIMLNIAEGHSRRSDNVFKNHLYIARGSTAEVKCALYIAIDQNYITNNEFKEIMTKSGEVSSVITGFIRYLRHYKNTNKRQKKGKVSKS